MKKSILALCALTLAAGLSACGGGSSDYTIGGTVTGLRYGPLVLVTNGMEVSIQPAKDKDGNLVKDTAGNPTTTYAFPNQLGYGEVYEVTAKEAGKNSAGTVLQAPHQVCTPTSGTKDTAGRLSVINAAFSCALVANPIGGTLNVPVDGLVLTNGGTQLSVPKDATTFTFGTPVTYGVTYGVTVLTQPGGYTCSVANGVGIMGDDPVTSIAVTCTANAAAATPAT